MVEYRPVNCRFRLQDEGHAYPRSSCEACQKGATRLGKSCSYSPIKNAAIDVTTDLFNAYIQMFVALSAYNEKFGTNLGMQEIAETLEIMQYELQKLRN